MHTEEPERAIKVVNEVRAQLVTAGIWGDNARTRDWAKIRVGGDMQLSEPRQYCVRERPSESSGDIAILSASYGGRTEESRIDVTKLLQAMASRGYLNATATNDVMGRDPAPGVVKTLEVTYRLGDVECTEIVPETWVMRIGKQNEMAAETAEEIDIIQAVLSDPEEFDVDGYEPVSYEPALVETRTSSGGVT